MLIHPLFSFSLSSSFTHSRFLISMPHPHTHAHPSSPTHQHTHTPNHTQLQMTEGSVILRTLGFHVESLSFNTFMLFAYLIIALGAAYLVLRYGVCERR